MNIPNYEEFNTRLREAEVILKEGNSEYPIVEETVPAEPVAAPEKPQYHVVDLGKHDLDIVEIKGGLQNIFTGEGTDDYIPKGSPSEVEALLRVKDALGQYQKLPVLDHNLIALYEEGRPVFSDQYTLFCMAERLSPEKKNDLFRHALGMFDTPGHGKKLATIDTFVKRGDCKNALEMLTILKLLADKSKNNAELYSTFGKKMITTAIDIYCHFRDNWREYKDMSQWEYETLLWAATEAQLHPEGIVKRCKEEIGMYDPDVDPELPKL